MTQTPATVPNPPVGTPAWLIRVVAAVVGLTPAILAWIDPGNKLPPHAAIRWIVILASLIIGAVIFIIHVWLAATHEYGWNMNAVTHAESDIETEIKQAWPEIKQAWPEIKQAYTEAKPALTQITGVQGAIDTISADVTALKAKEQATGLNPDELIAAFETATGQPWPFPKAPAAEPDPAVTGQTA